MEGAYYLAFNESAKFSEQQFIDCDILLNDGCYNGDVVYAYEYAIHNPIMNASDYPYNGGINKNCHLREDKAMDGIIEYHTPEPNKTEKLKLAIMRGPTAVEVASGNTYFRLYEGGILNTLSCPVGTDHDALAVGYDKSPDGVEYVIVKNSWGFEWGDNGYINIAFGSEDNIDFEGICGVKSRPSRPSYINSTDPNQNSEIPKEYELEFSI